MGLKIKFIFKKVAITVILDFFFFRNDYKEQNCFLSKKKKKKLQCSKGFIYKKEIFYHYNKQSNNHCMNTIIANHHS